MVTTRLASPLAAIAPLVRELFDLISDKISLSIPRLVSNQGEMTSPKEIMAKVKISRKIFTV